MQDLISILILIVFISIQRLDSDTLPYSKTNTLVGNDPIIAKEEINTIVGFCIFCGDTGLAWN